ncbi:DUF4138 domain-containing protein [Muricauda sp. NFXS6]|uniref:DUF4138 domain-containing protein n=1 Tax=Allomuricauda sp. NFXS6 TaxID=2819094 RepID=UPI0032DE7BBC
MTLNNSFYFFLILAQLSYGQHTLDTLYANEHQNVVLFFPDPIQKAVSGHSGFVFTYNREKGEHFGLLQGVPGEDSNLLVITSEGSVYAFQLQYARKLSQYHHFISKNKSIGNARPLASRAVPVPEDLDSLKKQPDRYREFCDSLVSGKRKHLAVRRKKGLHLRLEDMVYYREAVYMVLQLRNRSTIDFEVGHLNIHRVSGSTKSRAAYQEVPLHVRYRYRQPTFVHHGETKRFVLVVPKFVLGYRERLQISLSEFHGRRQIRLKCP